MDSENSVAVDRTYVPVIIIGAARSGTNMLRDVLTKIPGVGTWPCDEINYIWRHKNAGQQDDQFGPELATPSVQRFITKAFDKLALKHNLDSVLEKTCANSLRVSFINRIFPDAKFIAICRDGRDVVPSSMIRWKAKLELPYIIKKARFVPLSDLPYYGFKYFWNRITKLFSREQRISSWGPRFKGFREALKASTLAEICALQWARSVEIANRQLAQLDNNRVFRVKYENFVNSPVNNLISLCEFLGKDISRSDAEMFVKNVSSRSVGKGRLHLSDQEKKQIEPIIKEQLEANGYE